MDFVFASEGGAAVFLVGEDAAGDVAGYADVECAVALAGEDVDTGVFGHGLVCMGGVFDLGPSFRWDDVMVHTLGCVKRDNKNKLAASWHQCFDPAFIFPQKGPRGLLTVLA